MQFSKKEGMFCANVTVGTQGVLEEFLGLFPQLFSARQNGGFCHAITSAFERRQWKRLSAGLRNAAKIALEKVRISSSLLHFHSIDWIINLIPPA